MNRRLSRWLLGLYPRAFRDRYGQEVSSLTDELIGAGETTPLRAGFDLTFSAVSERGRALSRPRKVLVTAMAFAALLILGFALTGHQQAAGSRTAYTAVGSGCRVSLQARGKGMNYVRSAVQRQYWQKVTGKSAQAMTVVISRPKCGMPGLACNAITLQHAAPKLPPASGRSNFVKPRTVLGNGWTVSAHVKAPPPAWYCAVLTPAGFHVIKPAQAHAK
jgi:hypothetical protein